MFVSLDQMGGNAGPEQGTEEWFQRRKHKMIGSKPANTMFDCNSQEDWNRLHVSLVDACALLYIAFP